MQVVIDILENEIIEKYPDVLNILLQDHSTNKNIFWATDNYSHLGEGYTFQAEILAESISGVNGNIIMPRVYKDKVLQLSRSKEMAEVFTPSWICNAQNNIVDNAWLGREEIFNREIVLPNGSKSWITTKEKITFPEGKTWMDYITSIRMEITCGEAPYLVSRYDTTTGEFIEVNNRIGLLDRKLRVIYENVEDIDKWLEFAEIAYQNIYGYEWQGDSLLLAREAMLITFIENFQYKFNSEPPYGSILKIAEIISWNIWQMDGLKGVIPASCKEEIFETYGVFETKVEKRKCQGCAKQKIKLHNGIYTLIMDWKNKKPIRFIDLIKD